MKQQDTYLEVRTIRHEGIVARVHIPNLLPDERERRMKAISKAASQLLISRQK